MNKITHFISNVKSIHELAAHENAGSFIVHKNHVVCLYGTARYQGFWIKHALRKIANQDLRAKLYKYKHVLLLTTLLFVFMGVSAAILAKV